MARLLLLLPVCMTLAVAGPSDLERLQTVAPSLQPKTLDPATWKVDAWVLGAQRQRIRQGVRVKALYGFGETYYVEQEKPTRWLVGRRVQADKQVLECEQSFASLPELLEASRFAPLPRPPVGFTLREVIRLASHPTRLASDGLGKVLYVLCANGDVWRAELASGKLALHLRGEEYCRRDCADRILVGMTLDSKGRLYLVANERDDRGKQIINKVTIYRTTRTSKGDPVEPKPWVTAEYPWGIGPFNHGVGHIAQGPDGLLYVNSGSRTDGNEPGNDDRYSKAGEDPLTACLWRIDPEAARPTIEVHARGLRNAYGFCWNERGEMIATENGPDADAPEELNEIRKGAHYGFPFVYSDWTKKPYKHTPDAPPGSKFSHPILNLRPAGGGSEKKPLATLDPHSSPSGIVYLGKDFPAPLQNGYLIARFGNLLARPRVGFDVLLVHLERDGKGIYQARTTTLLDPIARPVDLHLSGKGRVYICEYSRQVDNKGYAGMLPGRVLELAVK